LSCPRLPPLHENRRTAFTSTTSKP
jgi:hypothetical protein